MHELALCVQRSVRLHDAIAVFYIGGEIFDLVGDIGLNADGLPTQPGKLLNQRRGNAAARRGERCIHRGVSQRLAQQAIRQLVGRRRAAHVTMLQRSPTYIVALPSQDAIANWLRRHLPAKLAYGLARWKAVLLGMYFYNVARWRPAAAKQTILGMVQQQLGPNYDIATHFTPRYNPWDQRLCVVPDGDLFTAIKAGRASLVTDEIATFTPTGIQLRAGEELPADIIVTATGLNLQLMSGVQLLVDGAAVDLAQTMSYKGMMYSDIPNLASAFGYTNASWTLKSALTAEYVSRLLNYMDQHGYRQCTPRQRDPSIIAEPALNFTSGYVQRALATLPHQGSRRPWKLYQNYVLDLLTLRFGAVDDGTMEFTRRYSRVVPPARRGRAW